MDIFFEKNFTMDIFFNFEKWNSMMNPHHLNSTPVVINIISNPRGLLNKVSFKAHIIHFLDTDNIFFQKICQL